jgi:hypothetical protein
VKFIKIGAIILLVVLVGIQFIPTKRNQSEIVPATDITKVYSVPQKVEAILKISCYDCHSNNTNYPWYNKVQPFSGILERHIIEGKEHLNFSEFGTYSKRKQRSMFNSMAGQIEEDEMPLDSYLWMHREAELSKNEKEVLLEWIEESLDNLKKSIK